ncbi:PREDICTED: uncharacterized protein LOC108611172 [Drosophila arizonae]|uniref:Uncharacterized protein LOC108611172 n=1 Tax=Drosophila arizonae TaxID=7263 RepID=A0ABM1NW13_DROAR|nr:PREDICTED: uncharacterized protein LOC108611172 [Drosophila arizonae]
MSLTEIKQKEGKAKKNVLPKLRTLLANPYKQHSPVLPESELLELQQIFKSTLNESAHTQQKFVTQNHIHLGLESSLRAINGRRFSCVFISLSLRPSHLVRLIATTASVKVPTAPIYAQPKLEDLTHEIFGVRALALVLPIDLNSISSKLAKWVEVRKKPVVKKVVKPASKKTGKKRKAIEQVLINTENEPQAVKTAPTEEKEWSGDYISCASDGAVLRISQLDAQTEAEQLSIALSKLGKKSANKTEIPDVKNTKPEEDNEIITLAANEPMEVDTAEAAEDDEFLPAELTNYQPLTQHLICANPNKKPKKKRNKNKKQTNQPPQKKSN